MLNMKILQMKVRSSNVQLIIRAAVFVAVGEQVTVPHAVIRARLEIAEEGDFHG